MRPFEDKRGLTWRLALQHAPHSLLVSNPKAYTLRGLHYQIEPAARTKIIHVISGRARFALVHVTTGKHKALNAVAGESVFVERFEAAGYLTLESNTVFMYEMSVPQSVECERGIRWDDPQIGIDWDGIPWLINERDRSWPDWSPRTL